MYSFVILVGIAFVFVVYRLINKSSLENDKIDKFIDYLKWVIITLSIPTTAVVIGNFYQERREAIEEMKYFEKYAGDVRDLTKIEERLQLVRYFSMVAPNSRIKKSWTNYYEEIKKDYDLVSKPEYQEKKLVEDSIKYKNNPEKIQEIQEIRNKKALIEANMSLGKDIVKAEKYENEGFQNLVDKDVFAAISSFEKSENAYNSYHQVYEIALLLKKDKVLLSDKKSSEWKSVYTKLVNDYKWKMPEEYKKKLTELAK